MIKIGLLLLLLGLTSQLPAAFGFSYCFICSNCNSVAALEQNTNVYQCDSGNQCKQSVITNLATGNVVVAGSCSGDCVSGVTYSNGNLIVSDTRCSAVKTSDTNPNPNAKTSSAHMVRVDTIWFVIMTVAIILFK